MQNHVRACEALRNNEGESVPRNARPCLLLVEDEMFNALFLEHVANQAGFDVLRAARLPAAMELAESGPIDAAILDVNLSGTNVFPAADMLQKRGIPFLFMSGYGKSDLPDRYRESSFLQKPFDESRWGDELAKLFRVSIPACPVSEG